MEKLIEHTLQRQLAEQGAQISEPTALVKRMASGQLALAAPAAQQIAQVNHGAGQVNTGPVTNNIINIHPWDGDRQVGVDLTHIIAAFSDNAKLKEYSQMGDHELTDPEMRREANPKALEVYRVGPGPNDTPAAPTLEVNSSGKRSEQFGEAEWTVRGASEQFGERVNSSGSE